LLRTTTYRTILVDIYGYVTCTCISALLLQISRKFLQIELPDSISNQVKDPLRQTERDLILMVCIRKEVET